VDPLAAKYPWNSPYSFQENKIGLGRELEGLELDKGAKFIGYFEFTTKLGLTHAEAVEGIAKGYSYGTLAAESIVILASGVGLAAPVTTEAGISFCTNPSVQFATVEVASFAANLFYEGADDPFSTPGPGGETGKLFRRVLKSIDKGLEAGKTTTILGRYYGGTKELIENGFEKLKGANILNVKTELQGKAFWDKYNKKFLDDAIERGDNISLTHDPTDMSHRYNVDGEITMFGREMEYLEDAGYHFNSETMEMVKPE
jgi:hypothetical protein